MDIILVTGGSGFLGSHYICHLTEKYRKIKIINLDLKEPSVNNHAKEKVIFTLGDIRDKNFLNSLFREYSFTGVVHFARESNTDLSLKNPELFVETNILGTLNLLMVAYQNWYDGPYRVKKSKEKSRFLYISTYEIYGSLGEYALFHEETPFWPNSPYAVTRASADFFVRTFHKNFGFNAVTLVSPNVFGPGENLEKLIPTIIRKAIYGEPIPIYGDGRFVRNWLYIRDFCKAVDLVYRSGKVGERYLVGGPDEWEHIALCRKICQILDVVYPISENSLAKERSPQAKSYADLIQFTADRPSHDRRYAVNAQKIQKELGFCPESDFDGQLQETILWYLDKYLGGKNEGK